jgi:hypothetical protein
VRRTLRQTISASAAIALTATFLFTGSTPVWAHTGGEVSTLADREHAEQDLAGTGMDVIEKTTETNKRRIKTETGVTPGQKDPKRRLANEPQSIVAAADPGIGGSWSSVIPTDVVPVFQAVLPNGKVLMWDSVGTNATETYPNQTFTRAMVWNPTNNTFKRVDVQGYNIFCAGYSQLPNGNVLVAGGNKNQALDGIKQTHIFNWQTETWSRGTDMQGERWYPSVTSLANGEASIIGGGPTFGEVYQNNSAVRKLSNVTQYSARIYPFAVSRPDSRLQLLGPNNEMYTVNTEGSGSVDGTTTRDGIYRDYGSFATYGIGKTLVSGGGSLSEGGKTNVPTKTATIVDTNGTGTSDAPTNSMSVGRRQHNLTILADGSVLATGGQSSTATSGLVDLQNPVLAAERWDPSTSQWTVLASASRIREYHSTAALLPDGRVLTGGGGICGDCQRLGYLEKNIEYFTPPYLYKKDGSGQLAARPEITSAPTTVSFNTRFAITSPQAATIRKIGLVRLGAPTHSVDQSQRYIPLSYTTSGTTLNPLGPANGGVAPPGHYMLFATDSAGVPSVAKIVNVQAAPVQTSTPIKGISGRCLDVPNANPSNNTRPWMYNCNGTAAQAWAAPADNTIRALGKCLDVSGNSRFPGAVVQIYTCNGTTAQQWVRQTSDRSIRLKDQPSLCLAVVGESTAMEAKVELRTCTGSVGQKWYW